MLPGQNPATYTHTPDVKQRENNHSPKSGPGLGPTGHGDPDPWQVRFHRPCNWKEELGNRLSQSGPGVLIGPGKSKVSVSTAVNPLDSSSVGLGRRWARLEPHCPESSVATSRD